MIITITPKERPEFFYSKNEIPALLKELGKDYNPKHIKHDNGNFSYDTENEYSRYEMSLMEKYKVKILDYRLAPENLLCELHHTEEKKLMELLEIENNRLLETD